MKIGYMRISKSDGSQEGRLGALEKAGKMLRPAEGLTVWALPRRSNAAVRSPVPLGTRQCR